MMLSGTDMPWYRLSLTQEQLEFGFADIIRAELEEIWIARGALEGFTVWLKEHTGLTDIYFSPIAAEAAGLLLHRFNASPCAMPDLETLSFLLGHVFQADMPTTENGS
jgi:hypothetical protein